MFAFEKMIGLHTKIKMSIMKMIAAKSLVLEVVDINRDNIYIKMALIRQDITIVL